MIKVDIKKTVEKSDPLKVGINIDLLRAGEVGKNPNPVMTSIAIIDLLNMNVVPQYCEIADICRLIKRNQQTKNRAVAESYIT